MGSAPTVPCTQPEAEDTLNMPVPPEVGVPRYYAEWVPLIERFSAGDDMVLGTLEGAEMEWTPGVAERLARRLHDAFNARIHEAQRRMQRDLNHAQGSSYHLSQCLLAMRRAFQPLVRFAVLPALPETMRTHLRGELERIARAIQADLEQSARRQGSVGDALLVMVRANPIRVPAAAEKGLSDYMAGTAAQEVVPGTTCPMGIRRRVILE